MNTGLPGTVTVALGVDLHVERSGSGAPVILLHGFTGDGTTMRGLAQRLESDAEVIVPDLVGHGRSCSPVDEKDYSVDAMAAQVAAIGEKSLRPPVSSGWIFDGWKGGIDTRLSASGIAALAYAHRRIGWSG